MDGDMCCAAVPIFTERSQIVKGEKEAPAPKEGEEAEEQGSDVKQVSHDVMSSVMTLSYRCHPLVAVAATPAGPAPRQEESAGEEVPPGIPEFWLNVLRNYEEIGETVRARRRPLSSTCCRNPGRAAQPCCADVFIRTVHAGCIVTPSCVPADLGEG
jgi:Nucleosome assembly protein (NAP)